MNTILNKPKQKAVATIRENIKAEIAEQIKNICQTINDTATDTW